MTRLLGSSLANHRVGIFISLSFLWCKVDVPCDVRRVEDTQAYGILMVRDMDGLLETQYLRIANVGAIDE
jgi:hypothetical protein